MTEETIKTSSNSNIELKDISFNRSLLKNQVSNFNFYLYLVTYVKENGKLPKTDKTPQAMQYYIKNLKLDGILIKRGRGVWLVNENNLNKLLTKKSSEVGKGSLNIKLIRGHGFNFKVSIPNIPNWERREEYLKQKGVSYNRVNGGYSIKYQDHTVWLCDKSLVIYFPDYVSYYEKNATTSKKLAIYDLKALLISLGNFFNADFSFKGIFRFKVSRQHYAKIKDELAKHYNDSKRKFECRDDAGILWLLIDQSGKVDELETVNSSTADSDTDNVIIPFYNDLRGHYIKTGETLLLSDVVKALHGFKENMQMYANNQASHLALISKLSQGIDRFSNKVDRINQTKLNSYFE